jgi:hypothetical protein
VKTSSTICSPNVVTIARLAKMFCKEFDILGRNAVVPIAKIENKNSLMNIVVCLFVFILYSENFCSILYLGSPNIVPFHLSINGSFIDKTLISRYVTHFSLANNRGVFDTIIARLMVWGGG